MKYHKLFIYVIFIFNNLLYSQLLLPDPTIFITENELAQRLTIYSVCRQPNSDKFPVRNWVTLFR